MESQRVIMVGGGKGGVGKSSVTAGIARRFVAVGLRVGVIDADLSGPSQSLLFDCSPMRAAGGHIQPSASTEGIRVSSIGLIAKDDTALVWSDPAAVAAIDNLIDPQMWRAEQVLLVDLPPGQGVITSHLAQRFGSATCILVTTGSALALEECGRAAKFLRRMEMKILGVVENMAEVACSGCGAKSTLHDPTTVSRKAAELDLPVLARLPYTSSFANAPEMNLLANAILHSPSGMV